MWNKETSRYDIETEEEALTRLLNAWNLINNTDIKINEIKGSGLEALFYTYLQFYTALQSGIVDIASFMTYNIIQNQVKINRPNVIGDNITSFGASLGVEVIAFDPNSPKLAGLPDGAYFIFKTQPSNEVLDTIFKSCIVVGTKTYGALSKDVVIANNQSMTFKYGIATDVPDFRLKIRYKLRYETSGDAVITDIKQAVASWYASNYKLGMNIVVNDITSILINNDFPYLDEIKVEYSLDNGLNWIEGSYEVAYDRYVEVSDTKIDVEAI